MIRRYLPFVPVVVRFTPSQTAKFGEALGSIALIGWGRIVILIALPTRWQKPDPLPSIFDLNAHLRSLREAVEAPTD